ncbi:hypothetical protein [Actinokineospora globicatena]|uniref:hypothetical protein n=1 Tax=Actinokineospora globicatena TaxID=103729 RepID=UPI0020A45810|nr:hypothetical protein [Actinokineospora globicatena]MCP2304933.1 hypothetical protein [Actinokineospora globicatena]GLW77683.1 hypothetical protein Aglo01_21650 [Actinokineospora globicatena]GLW85648.1 hypothetical protein Aglo02_32880 [Actinokineospora globicatena]
MVTVRKYFLEAFLATAGAAACGAVSYHSGGSTTWTVIAMLLGGVAIACFAASLTSSTRKPDAQDITIPTQRRRRGPRRLGTRRLFGSSPTTTAAPRPRQLN